PSTWPSRSVRAAPAVRQRSRARHRSRPPACAVFGDRPGAPTVGGRRQVAGSTNTPDRERSMTAPNSNGPLLKAAGLWQKTSAKGNEYFIGGLGGVKILILANADRSTERDPTHSLFFAEAANRATPDRARSSQSQPEPRATPRHRSRASQNRGPAADNPRPFDDPIP